MEDYREELACINLQCERLGITGAVLCVSQVAALTGCCRKTAASRFRWGGTKARPIITRRQLARQLVELSQYQERTSP